MIDHTERLPDPFARDSDLWQSWKQHEVAEFSQPDLTPTTLKDWLRSQECANELGGMHEVPVTPATLPEGVYLQPSGVARVWRLYVPRGGWLHDIYEGRRDELLSIVQHSHQEKV